MGIDYDWITMKYSPIEHGLSNSTKKDKNITEIKIEFTKVTHISSSEVSYWVFIVSILEKIKKS